MTAAEPQVNRWIVSLSVVFATFMEVLDTTVVNVSLPHIAGSMSATVEEGTWTLTSYLVANAIILPMTGWLAQQFGRKKLLLMAITGFTGASIMCGLAPNLATLIIFRIIQGACGGTMQPMSQAIMLESFPPEERGKAMAAWAICIVTAPILGPVVGGWLTDTYSWRWIFYINIPVGIVSFVMAKMFVFDPPYMRKKAQSIDYWGIGMLAVGMGALQIMLDKGQQDDWFTSNFITVLAVIAVVLLLSFIIYEIYAPNPILHLRVFRDRTYAIGVFVMTTVGFVLYGSLVLLPIILQTLLGYPALQSGIAMAPRGIGSLLFMPVVGMVIGKIGARKILATGIIVCAISMFWFGFLNLNAGYWDFFWPQFIQGISMGMLFVPMTTITMDRIRKEEMGNATSIFNLMRNIGGSIGIATAATLLERHRQMYTNTLGEHVTAYGLQSQQMLNSLRSAMMAGGSDPVTATEKAHAMLFWTVQRQATMLSFLDLMKIFGGLFVLILPLIYLAKPPRAEKRGPEAAAH
jgi:MFS transporter, DHA2 family, multidrug resistance protein